MDAIVGIDVEAISSVATGLGTTLGSGLAGALVEGGVGVCWGAQAASRTATTRK
jgi:hypothetical protein